MAVRGPFSEAAAPEGVVLLDAPPDLAGAMSASDLVVSSAGQTMLEALATAAPTVAVVVAEDQRAQAATVNRAAAAEVCKPADLESTLTAVAGDLDRRGELSRAARDAVDGLGAHRTALEFLAAVGQCRAARPGLGGVELRPTRAADSAMLLALRNDPMVRRSSRHTHEVGTEEHAAWLQASLTDPSRMLMIVEVGGNAAGQVRLDSTGSTDWELSVSVLPDFRGSGVGRAAVRSTVAHALVELRAAAIVAWIREDNEASQRMFQSVGFVRGNGEASAGLAEHRCTQAVFRWD